MPARRVPSLALPRIVARHAQLEGETGSHVNPAAGRPAAGTTACGATRTSGAGRTAVGVDGRAVARAAELEGAGRCRIVAIRAGVAGPARRQRGHRVQERTTDLAL